MALTNICDYCSQVFETHDKRFQLFIRLDGRTYVNDEYCSWSCLENGTKGAKLNCFDSPKPWWKSILK